MTRVPRVLAAIALAWTAIGAAFLVSGPWRIGAVRLDQWSIVPGLFLLSVALAAVSREVRDDLGRVLRADVRLSRATLGVALAIAAAVLLRTVFSAWAAFEVNAWDFSVNFDRPIERTLHGTLLYSDEFGMSMLGNHATWLSFAFVPLYAIAASPYWLLAAQALAVAGALAAAFAFFRAEGCDDFVAFTLTAALLFNRYTAKALQYVFHPEIFYLPALFLLYAAFLRRRPVPFAAALLLAVSIKEDAILPIFGFALTAALVHRRWRWAAAAAGTALAVFAVDYFVVLPAFAGAVPGQPWYAAYWSSYGATPFEALGGMLRDPFRVTARVLTGARDLFLSTGLLPLLGPQWLLAAFPALVIYGSADMEKLHWFTLYYATPVLPAVFAALPPAIRRLQRALGGSRAADPRVVGRLASLFVLAASLAVGAGHVLREPHPDRARLPVLLRQAPAPRAVWVQGALFPHVGYEPRFQVLNERASVDGRAGFLLSPNRNPYPYDRRYVEELVTRLDADPRYRRFASGELVLFVARMGPMGPMGQIGIPLVP